MRILHFSDFHLNGKKLAEAQQILDQMIAVINKLKEEQKFDLVIFTGDMLEQGGDGFDSIDQGFIEFENKVIMPLLKATELSKSRFIFTPGNHDIDRDADDEEMLFDGIEKKCSTEEGIVAFIKDKRVDTRTRRIDAFKAFEKKYYEPLGDLKYTYSRFNSTFELDIDGKSVGIVSMNTVWRCSNMDKHSIAMGINQINENGEVLKNKHLALGITHYPIASLKEAEREDVRKLSSREFDIFLCGHTHGGGVNFQAPFLNCAFLEVNAAGSLAGNIYEAHKDYQNGFQVIDCDSFEEGLPPKHYIIRNYVQQLYKNFVPDGVNEKFYPDNTALKYLHEEYLKNLAKENAEKKRLAILPFMTIKEYANGMGKNIMESNFVLSDKIKEIQKEIIEEKNAYRLMALSGMGKTRIVLESMLREDDVYYTNVAECFAGLTEILNTLNPHAIIVDNCDKEHLDAVNKIIAESGKSVKLITINNVLSAKETSTDGKVRVLTYDDTEEIVDKMIENEDALKRNPNLAQIIKDRSGKIPYMAVMLINAYKKNRSLRLEESDSTLSAILRGSSTMPLEKNTENALKAISMFNPLGFEGGVENEYEFVVGNSKIHHINLDQKIVNNLFKDTIREYEYRQLIEHFGECIRMRPQPLAEWLTESWMKEYADCLPEIVKDIDSQPEQLAKRLFRALDRRFRDMDKSPYTKQLFDELNDTVKGSFHNEELVFSSTGSQLLLSMGLVSPVAVSKNIWSLLDNRTIEWLHANLDGDARRYLVWALENLCMPADAFNYAALSLAKLAVAENEGISNNATGLFMQLFHLLLSGTQAKLNARLELLKQLACDSCYHPLVVKAIDHALNSRNFSRSNTSGARQYEDPKDYNPTIGETLEYWTGCIELLKKLDAEDETMLPIIKSILASHVSDFNNLGVMNFLYSQIDYFGARCDFDWPEMRDSLSMCYQHWFRGSEEEKEQLKSWINRLMPRSFFGRLKASIKDEHHTIGNDYERYQQEMSAQMNPFAEEFIQKEIYRSEEMISMMDSKDYMHHWFYIEVANVAREEGRVDALLSAIYDVVKTKDTAYESQLVITLARYIDRDVMLSFADKLYEGGYYRMACSVVGEVDDENHSRLEATIERVKSLPECTYCVNNYLRFYSYSNPLNVLSIFDILIKAGMDVHDVCYNFLATNMAFRGLKELEEAGLLGKYQTVLLDYSFDENHGLLTSEIINCINNILEERDSPDFAFAVHRKIIEVLNKAFMVGNPFDRIYANLLPKYQDSILADLLDTIADKDKYAPFYYQVYMELGSGFSTGSGPLFQCNEQVLKTKCKEHPSTLPSFMAHMCPVYSYTDGKITGFSEFFLWLCDNFGDNMSMLHEFSANMGTTSWSGIDGYSEVVAMKIPFFEPLLNHPKPTVQEWAKSQLEGTKKEVAFEKGKEDYEKMIR